MVSAQMGGETSSDKSSGATRANTQLPTGRVNLLSQNRNGREFTIRGRSGNLF